MQVTTGPETDTETSLERVQAELTALTEEFQEFAYIVSHDLSGPLRHASGFAEMVLAKNQDTLDEKSKRHLSHIINSAQKGREMLEQLTAYSRLNTREQTLENNINPADLIEGAKGELSGLIEKSGAHIRYENLPELTGDRARLTLVFQNLLENALTYQPPSQTPDIEIKCGSEGAIWVFSIQDNGIGIPESGAADIFKVFRRAVDKEDFPGMGMGLPYAKKAIEKHHGRLWLDSTSELGSTFCFTLPKAKPS